MSALSVHPVFIFQVGPPPQELGVPNLGQAVAYSPVDPASFEGIIKRLRIRCEEFSFFDFGSGKGRALLLASRFPLKRVIGPGVYRSEVGTTKAAGEDDGGRRESL